VRFFPQDPLNVHGQVFVEAEGFDRQPVASADDG